MSDTTKACLLAPNVADLWQQMVTAGEIPDRGMVLDQQLTDQQTDGSLVYTLPAENIDAFLDDLNKVLGRLARPAA